MKKMDLVENENIGISSSTLAKMSRGENVSMSILEKICIELDCDFGDIVSIYRSTSIEGNNDGGLTCKGDLC